MPLQSLTLSLVAALTTSGALATPIFVGHIQFAESYGSTGGGEFRAIPQPDFTVSGASTGTAFQFGVPAAPPQFETFCMEKFEHIDTTGTVFSADINTNTVASAPDYAGGAHGGFNDPIDPRTAYLYTQFIHHTLITPYDYSDEANRITDANALQEAIWFIEEEDSTPLDGTALAFLNEANNAVNSGTWIGIGDVRILNIYSGDPRTEFQDELILIPTPGALLLSISGILALSRRRR